MILSFSESLRAVEGKKHILLGNGFSIAYKHKIFNYSSIFESSEISSKYSRLNSLFNKLNTKDFEVCMNAIKQGIALHSVYYNKDDVLKLLEDDYENLRKILIGTLTKTHPDSPADVTASEYEKCLTFLNHFDRVYTLNYDLLLYWVLLKQNFLKDDGFRDPFVGDPIDYKAEEFVAWTNDNHSQNVYYMHGALHLSMSKHQLKKFTWSRTGIRLKDQIDTMLSAGEFPLVVTESSSNEKLSKIQRSNYLGHAYRSLPAITGSLFIFGHSLAENDEHILEQIAKNKSLSNVFISIYGDPNSELNRYIISRGERLQFYKGKQTKKRIMFYDAESAAVWR